MFLCPVLSRILMVKVVFCSSVVFLNQIPLKGTPHQVTYIADKNLYPIIVSVPVSDTSLYLFACLPKLSARYPSICMLNMYNQCYYHSKINVVSNFSSAAVLSFLFFELLYVMSKTFMHFCSNFCS